MKLVTHTSVLSRVFGDKKAVEIIKSSGFDAMDYSMFCMDDDEHILNSDAYYDYVTDLRKFADEIGIPFVQAHAPFGFTKEHEDDFENKIIPKIARSMEIASILGAKIIVVHPIHQQVYRNNEALMKEKNMRFYRSLIPYCEKYNIKVAVENMWQWNRVGNRIVPDVCSDENEFADYIDTLNSPWITACLDVGHCGLTGFEAADAIRTLGKRIGCLHVHDVDYVDDLHTLPYLGKVDWDAVTQAFADIDYNGYFTYECNGGFLSKFDDELIPVACEFMCNVGRHLISKIEKAKNEK